MGCWEKWKPTIWSLQMKPGSEPTRRAPESWTYGDHFFPEMCLALLGTCRKEGGLFILILLLAVPCGALMEILCCKRKEMIQLAGQLQPTLLACLVPEVVMCLGCHLLVKFGFCLRVFVFFHFFLPLTEALWSGCQRDIPILCFRISRVTGWVFNTAK